jgi:hypothetical protein
MIERPQSSRSLRYCRSPPTPLHRYQYSWNDLAVAPDRVLRHIASPLYLRGVLGVADRNVGSDAVSR